MPKSAHQKYKLLLLLQILQEESDEEHPIPGPRLLQLLEGRGIAAERKSLYDDINALRELGYDVQFQRGRGYFLGERDFQLAELKLLVDAVQSSRFIPAGKSDQLIKKLERLTSVHHARELQRQVYVAGRVKSLNESVYYSIDALHQAIGDDRQVRFRYYKYDRERQKILQHGGSWYQVSPYALLRSDENYYLVAYDGRSREIRHYRVDKMVSLTQTDWPREGGEAYRSFDLGAYTRLHFGMFRGREADVTLRCENRMADILIDRFGTDLSMAPDGPEHFTCMVHLAVSQQFFGWLFGLGPGIRLTGPEWAVRELEGQLEECLALHREK